MAKQIFGKKFSDMSEAYQDKMNEAYGGQAEAEHKARGEAQTRAQDLKPKDYKNLYKVKDNNFDEFVTSGNARLTGAGGAGNRTNEGDEAGPGKNKVSSADFAALFKANLKKNATKADKIELKRGLMNWGQKITPEFEKDDVASVQAAGYGGGVEKRFANWGKRVDAYDAKQAEKNTPVDNNPSQAVASRPGGSENSSTQGINVGDIATGRAEVTGDNNDVNTGIQDSFNQTSTIDNSRVYEGDDRTLNIYRDNKPASTDNVYAPQADYGTDYSDATMAGFFQPSDSPAESQKFLNKYMTGLSDQADNFSDSMTNLQRDYSDNLAMVDYGKVQERMNQLQQKYEDRAELDRLQSQPTAASAFKGLKMGSLPKKVEDETEEIYGSFA